MKRFRNSLHGYKTSDRTKMFTEYSLNCTSFPTMCHMTKVSKIFPSIIKSLNSSNIQNIVFKYFKSKGELQMVPSLRYLKKNTLSCINPLFNLVCLEYILKSTHLHHIATSYFVVYRNGLEIFYSTCEHLDTFN